MVAVMGPKKNGQRKEVTGARPVETCLVKDATIVGGDIVGVEEEAFLHWTGGQSSMGGNESGRGFTSLEAGDRSGYLYTSGEEDRKGREGEEEYES